jgi:hypothetical protein
MIKTKPPPQASHPGNRFFELLIRVLKSIGMPAEEANNNPTETNRLKTQNFTIGKIDFYSFQIHVHVHFIYYIVSCSTEITKLVT